MPVYVADYVLVGYGTGAIMAVPGHDTRDWEFARAMGLPIVEVISGGDVARAAHTGDGVMVNSGDFSGTATAGREAVRKVIAWVEAQGFGRGAVTYKLRDWVFARQRYWGEPIPVLKDGDTVVRTLTADELPLPLPAVADYRPRDTGESPRQRDRLDSCGRPGDGPHALARDRHDAGQRGVELVLPAVLRPAQHGRLLRA